MVRRLFSFLILVLLSPIFIFTAFLIILDDGFPVFFSQKRVGLNNIYFGIYYWLIASIKNFIGPRPALYNQDNLIELRTILGIHKLMPGITGWAQVNGRDELSIPDKVKMDEFYLKNQSIWLDIKILFFTNLKVFKSSTHL